MDSELSEDNKTIPLCVDLDGTLVNTDTLIECCLTLLKKNLLYALLMPIWLAGGKARFKEHVSRRCKLNPASLPYNNMLLDWLRTQREGGRTLVLVTAAHADIAQAIANHLQLFSTVIASTSNHNLSAQNKRDELDKIYGMHAYDYAGNSRDDLQVWQHSRRAIVVNARESVSTGASRLTEIERSFPRQNSVPAELLRAMRPRQWSKNLLIFVNILMAHQLTDGALLGSTILAFVAFCLCSSSVYLINDLLDLEVDRLHSSKHTRPFASGKLPLEVGVVAGPALLLTAIILAGFAGGIFLPAMLLYFVVTLAYSLVLKRAVILDVLILAVLYTLRIVAGAAVAGVMPSFWLLSFSIFIFTSLAMAKRYAELKSLEADPSAWASGRGYHVGDIMVIANLGVAAGYIATLVLALYINSPDVVELYEHSALIWLLCPLLMYWIGRIWLLANRGELTQDPVVFATRDPASYVVGIFALLTLWAAV